MDYNIYTFTSLVWLYPGMAGWHFITVPKDISDDITKQFGDKKHGWGSLPVTVTIGKTTWKTSIFPDKKIDAYLLPLKADVRKKEGIIADQSVSISIKIIA